MTFFTASFETVFLRFCLMMVTIVGSFLAGIPALALLALPIFLSAMTGMSFGSAERKNTTMTVARGNVQNTKVAA